MTINNNDCIILLSCPLRTLICSDSQLCSFINSPSAVISDGEVRQQNLRVPSLTIFFLFFFLPWTISIFSFVHLWRSGESMGERGHKCAFWHVDLSHWTAFITSQDSAVFGYSSPPSCLLPIFKKNKYVTWIESIRHILDEIFGLFLFFRSWNPFQS